MKKESLEMLLRCMDANSYEWSFIIPEDEVVFVQKALSLKGKSDDELYNLWNDVSELLSKFEKGSEAFNLSRDYGITILEIINQSKSFRSGIHY